MTFFASARSWPLPWVCTALLFTACGEPNVEEEPPADTGVADPDTGVRPDVGPGDTGVPNPDGGVPDSGDIPDLGPVDTGPPPVVAVSGKVIKLGAYLAGTTEGVAQASLLALGVSPPTSVIAGEAPNAGDYTFNLPPDGQVTTFANKLGYFPSYNKITTQAAPITGKNLYLAENAWLNEIATAHNVDLNTPFNCHAPPQGNLSPNDQCIYGVVVGRILDDGTAGAGTVRPQGGIAKTDFGITGGTGARAWYVKGPYFLNYTGTSSATAQASIVYNDNGTYKGGLYLFFAEIPRVVGPESLDLQVSISYTYQALPTRYFGPTDVKIFRPYGVSWANIPESGIAPTPPVTNIDFDTQIYPLTLPVAQGGLGCQGCHTNRNGAVPSGGMNLYGGPEIAYNSWNPAMYPNRVNLADPSSSLILTKPLYEAVGLQDHPIVAFASDQDPAYRLIYTWIQEGATRDVVILPVSFLNEVRPLLYKPSDQGGAGCYACHVNGVDALTAPGGFYMGGNAQELYDALTNTAPTDNGATGEPYRINKQGNVAQSLVLINPLFGNIEPHPVKIFAGNADPRYQLIYRWISEGYQNN